MQSASSTLARSGVLRLSRLFHFQLGSAIPHLDVAYQIVGEEHAPVIFIAPSMSHSYNVTRTLSQRQSNTGTKGWWENTVGWGDQYGVDLRHYRVVSASPLGSPHATTSPSSCDPLTGREYRMGFPVLTPNDQARCHASLIEALGLGQSEPLHAMIGSSMGGMSVIEAMIHHTSIASRAVVIATTARTSPSTQALRSVQRDAVRLDPKFNNGQYDSNGRPDEGMRLARKIGTIAYRSRQEFDARFRSPPTQPHSPVAFPVDDYLEHQSASFGARYDACCYLRLSECMDLQDIGRPFDGDYDRACAQIARNSQWLVMPVKEDALIPAHELDRFAATLGRHGVRVHLDRLSSHHGHDAFLTQSSAINWRIRAFLSGGVDGVRQAMNEYNGPSI